MMNGLTNFGTSPKWREKIGMKLAPMIWDDTVMFISTSQGLEIICFSFFSFLSSFFWIENYRSPFIPVKFLHYFFIPVFPPFGTFIFLSFASKRVLGPWELPPGAFSRTMFVSFHVVSFLYCVGSFSFLRLENCPWKLSNPFRFFFVFVSFWLWFLPLPWKLTSEIVKKRFFSNPFRCFSRYRYWMSCVMCGIGMKRPGSVWLCWKLGLRQKNVWTVLFSRSISQHPAGNQDFVHSCSFYAVCW